MHECGENKKNGLLTDADTSASVHCLNRERNCSLLMADDSYYSDMLCFTNYIKFLSHDVGGEGVGHCYILSKLLYNIIWGRRCYKLAFTILIHTKLEVE